MPLLVNMFHSPFCLKLQTKLQFILLIPSLVYFAYCVSSMFSKCFSSWAGLSRVELGFVGKESCVNLCVAATEEIDPGEWEGRQED